MQPESLELAAGQASLTLYPQYGGVINALVMPTAQGPKHVMAGVAPEQLPENPGYRGVALFPFPNRLRDGRYEFAGREYRFDINEASTQTALHGFLFQLSAQVNDETRTEDSHGVTLVYDCDGRHPGYPFKARVEMTYTLRASGALEVVMAVKNTDTLAIPVGLGWHPYYTLGRSVDECVLQMPPARRVMIDERMLPTGEQVEETRFVTPAALGETAFDDCFELDAGRQQAVLWSEQDSFGLSVWQEAGTENMNFMQLYIPPDRQSMAIEPMSCGIDAFNTGAGLVVLQPGQGYRAVFGVQPITEFKK